MEFKIVVTGIGGQGVLTLGQILTEAALLEGFDVVSCEQHGLAQRGGHIESHISFGEKVFSPLVMQASANLIFGLEPLEALRAAYYASKNSKTIFVIDKKKIIPLSVYYEKIQYPSLKEIEKKLMKFSEKVEMIDASEKAKEIGKETFFANIYMLGFSLKKNYLPIKKENAMKAIEKIVPEKYLEINKKVFEAAFS